jgi:hypothetical protein
MAVAQGYGKTVTSGSVFAYDVADTRNSYIGEPTTNVFTHYGTVGQGSGADNGVTFSINGTGTFIRLGYGQSFGDYTIKPEDVVYKYNLGNNGCHYHGNSVSIPSGKYVTFTFDYYVSPGTTIENTYLANLENYGGSALGGGIGAPNSLTGVWQTVTATFGPTGGSGTQAMFLYPGGCGPRFGNTGYILYKNPQVEFLPHKTPFVQTTRSATQGLLPLVGNSTIDLTNVSFDSNAKMVFDGTNDRIDTSITNVVNNASYEVILYCRGNVSTHNMYMGQYLPYMGVFGGNTIYYSDSINGVQTVLQTNSGTIAYNTYYHVVCMREYNGTNTVKRIYINGNLMASTTVSGAKSAFANPDTVTVGDGAAFTWYPFYGEIPVAKIYNRALSAGEVRQNYLHYKTRFNLS